MGSISDRILLRSLVFLPVILNFFSISSVIFSATKIRSSEVYLLKFTTLSNLLMKALSKPEKRFVVAITRVLSLRLSRPLMTAVVALPISRRSLELVLSIASASISSKSTIADSLRGMEFISSNSSAMFFEVCPNRLSIKESKFTVYTLRCRMGAICFTLSVFPVPGLPSKRNLFTPLL